MSFPRYPAYKDSGVEWLGEVPVNWGVTALKRGFNVSLGKMLQPKSSNPDDELLPYLRAANIQWSGVDATVIKQMWLSKRDRTQLRLEIGDLLVSEGGDVGRSCLWADELDDCYFQNSVNRVRARDGHLNRYLYYWMSTIKDKGYIDVICNKSTIAHFTAEKVAAVPVPFPSYAEQKDIVAFLDRETAKIDALVAEQRRLMGLLKEKRQAVISHAVTKGLNPDSTMKPSGVEWLGDVPAHWQNRRVKSVSTFTTSGPRGWSDHVGDDGSLFIQSGDLNNSLGIDFFGAKKVQVGNDAEAARTRLSDGDVVVCITGAKTGNVAVCITVPDVAYINQHLCLIRPSPEILPMFLGNLLKSSFGQTYFNFSQYGLKQGLSLEDVRNGPTFLPPLAEQLIIVDYVNAESTKFDALITEAQCGIDLLQERRSALISAAVTGQIDVREACA